MRRWNGWGDDEVRAALPSAAAALLTRLIGPGRPTADATLDAVVAAVPPTRLAAHVRLDLDPEVRARHARGQSLPDWIALRSGRLGSVPDAVAWPTDVAGVRDVLALAASRGARLIPYGGGTGVVGGVNVAPDDRPVITVSLERMAGLVDVDTVSHLATFRGGTPGPALEAALAEHGLILGHRPQSWEYSTVGGWVATRSAGQESLGYGRIEDLFAGGHLETPAGPIDLPTHPASAAGPDLRHVILGSEGRAGIITDVVVRASVAAEAEHRVAFVVGGWDRTVDFAQALAQAALPLAMVRTSTPLETATTFALGAESRGAGVLRRYLDLRAPDGERCLLIVGAAGPARVVRAVAGAVAAIAGDHHAVRAPGVASAWERQRFRGAYLRNTLWDAGYAVDTIETAVDWGRLRSLAAALGPALRQGLSDDDERVHAFSHLSHVYPTGSSLYATYVFRLGDDPAQTLSRWERLKTAATRVILEHGGTVSHQHGVGRDHAPYLAAEKGPLGMAAMRGALGAFDPDGIMAPGVLLGEG